MIIISAHSNIYLILLPLCVELIESSPDPLDELTINVNMGEKIEGPYTTVNCGVKKKGTEFKNPNSRIVGGNKTEVNEYPWIAQLEWYGFAICGASVIAAEWILTAAHCFSGREFGGFDVIIGEHNTTSDTETNITKHVKPIRMITHPEYDHIREVYDIGLLRIPPIDLNTYTPVCLPTQGADYTDKNAWTYGWGHTKSEGHHSSPVLLDVQVPVVSDAEAYKKFASGDYHWILTDAELDVMVFAGEVGKDSCQGDSGGPLTYANPANDGRHEQIGIVSWGYGCGDIWPGAYTEVSALRSWIEDQITDNGGAVFAAD